MMVTKQGSIITKTINGITTETDLTPVEKITNTLDKLLRERKNFLDRRHIAYSVKILEEIEDLDNEQLKYLTNNLVGLTFKYADLYQRTLDNPEEHLDSVNKWEKIKEICRKST